MTREDLINPESIVKFTVYTQGLYQMISERLDIPIDQVRQRGNGNRSRRPGTLTPSYLPPDPQIKKFNITVNSM